MTWWVLAAPFVILGVFYAVYIVATRSFNLYRIAEGKDGRTSTSKAQLLLWTAVVIPCYAALFTANWRSGHIGSSLSMPSNLLAALGIGTATAVGAKALYLGTPEKQAKGAEDRGGLLTDDTGFPELAKIQLVGWTLLAVGIFCIRVIHALRHADPNGVRSMPDIDPALLTLMGIGHAGYFGKKVIDRQSAVPPAAPKQPRRAPAR